MSKYEKLSQKALYRQPKYLCGPSCMLAARDYLKNCYASEPGAFQAAVVDIAQHLESQKLSNPVTVPELLVVAKMIGLSAKSDDLQEDAIRALRPVLTVVKIAWRSYGPIMRLARKYGDFDSEEEHYVLVIGKEGGRCVLWEPAFSGEGQSPWLELTWPELQEGNRLLRLPEESGKAIFLL